MTQFTSNVFIKQANQKLFQQGTDFQGNMPLCIRFSLGENCNLQCTMCQRTQLPDT